MNKRTIPSLAATVLLSATVLVGCAESEDSTPTSSPTAESTEVETGEPEVNPDITAEQTAFVDEILATPLPQDEVTARIEDAGYTWRLGTIDGEPQAVTMDYRTDRLTLTTQDGLVIDATWG